MSNTPTAQQQTKPPDKHGEKTEPPQTRSATLNNPQAEPLLTSEDLERNEKLRKEKLKAEQLRQQAAEAQRRQAEVEKQRAELQK